MNIGQETGLCGRPDPQRCRWQGCRITIGPATRAALAVCRRGIVKGVIFGESRGLSPGNLIRYRPPPDCSHEDMATALDVFDEIPGEMEAEGIASPRPGASPLAADSP